MEGCKIKLKPHAAITIKPKTNCKITATSALSLFKRVPLIFTAPRGG